MTQLTINEAKDKLIDGQVIAYPTEAVFGLGCDPDDEQAVLQLLTLKNRAIDKGLILIAHQFELLKPYIDLSSISDIQKKTMLDSWPAPITWIVPKNKNTPYYLTGKFDSIAIRVSDQKIVGLLCEAFGKPLVSTSANLSGLAPCLTVEEVEQQFGLDFPVVSGQVGGYLNPSEIRDLKTGLIIRHG